jgi:YfiH family protein
MFQREVRDGKFLGYRLERDGRLFFFGSRFVTRAQLADYFPRYDFRFLKQVHGRVVIDAPAVAGEMPVEADAHFTDVPGTALVVQSADCVPILLASPRRVAAIHSGWRGTAQNIVAATGLAWGPAERVFAAIGPHILRPSFEIGRDVIAQLRPGLPATTPVENLVYPHARDDKAYFDLTEMVRAQLRDAFGSHVEISECLEDTVQSANFHSFRRDRERSERQYSFVVINP